MLKRLGTLALCTVLLFGISSTASAQESPIPAAPVDVASILDSVTNQDQVSTGVIVILLLAVLSLAPALVIMLTSFVRIIIVLSFTRTALATQSMPPYQVLVGIALFLTFFIMAPQFQKIYEHAWVPYQNQEISSEEMLTRGVDPIRNFMLAQLDNRKGMETLALFISLGDLEQPETEEDIPTYVIIPAFMINELRIAFEMGVLVFIPFIIIDVIMASVLLSMGLIFLPPVLVSLPFKIVLFVLVDGWRLLTETLVGSFVLP